MDGVLTPRWLAVTVMVLGWLDPASGWASSGKDTPDATKRREAEALTADYERLEGEGKYDEAVVLAERACSTLEEEHGKASSELASCLAALGVLHDLQGAYTRAESHLERALAMGEKELGPHHPLVATVLSDLAVHYYTLGAYGRAEPLLERALAIHEEALGPYDPLVAIDLDNLAALYRAQGSYEDAEALHLRALAIQKKALHPQHPELAMTLDNLATLYRDKGMYEEAETLHLRALAIQEKALGPQHPTVATSLRNLALVYEERGAYEEAEALHLRALAIFADTLRPDHPNVATSLNNLAMLYHDQGQHDLALKPHQRTLDIEEINLVRNLTVADETRRLAYAAKLSSSLHYTLSLHLQVVPRHDGIAELALTTLLRRKNRVQDLVSQSNAALRRSLPEEDQHLLDEIADVGSRIAVVSGHGPSNITTEAHAQRLDEIRRQRDQLWNELAEHSSLVEAPDHPVTIEDVQRALSAGRVLIEIAQYVPYHDDSGARVRRSETKLPPRYAAYLVFPDRFDWVDLGPAAPVDEHVRAFRHALQTKQANPTALYDTVMRPIVDKLGSTRHLIIAPAGNLSLIPFGALHDGERYLVEQYDLRYVTTGRDLLDPPASPPVTTTPVTIVANPTGADLPDAELEADFLRSFFPRTRVLLKDQATETNVRTIERPLILHMATHGFFGVARNERDNPMFRSGLYLADIEQVDVDRERDDGQLTAYEVSGMDLRGTQLVVLSACETGMGDVIESEGKPVTSEGLFGLRRAFAVAGARTTVTSLWGISGATTQKLMAAYYRKLAEGLGRGEAMQAIQLELLHTEEHRHPRDWAAFIASGDDTPLTFPPGQEPRLSAPEPPELETSGGCASKPLRRNAPVGSMPVGLLGLAGVGRRRRRPTRTNPASS